MAATIHFITGKGGVGKSTFAATLATHLSQKKEGPVLLLEVQGSGRSLEMLGAREKSFENKSLNFLENTWGARIFPKESFKQYFSLLLAMGDKESGFALVTESLREKITDLVFDNKIVSAFVDVCPGLEPAVLLGKIHWEATLGSSPEIHRPWKHVIVDAPATGHGLMLFRSTAALMDVFGMGLIFRQARDIMNVFRNPQQSKFYVVSSVEELPLKESRDLIRESAQLELPTAQIVFNRFQVNPENTELDKTALQTSPLDEAWKHEVLFEHEASFEQDRLLNQFLEDVKPSYKPLYLPEVFVEKGSQIPQLLSAYLVKDLQQ